MPEKNGLEVLKRSKMINEGTVGLVMTAYGTVESAVDAMKAGAYDYVLKPFDLEEMELKVDRAVEHRRLLARIEAYDRTEIVPRFENIVGESPQMKDVFRTIEKVARSNATVLVLGETGVGKELVAEALHRNSSRADRPFVKMNCAALHENLLESELFGHERGAFTGAEAARKGKLQEADKGTLLLDEVADMSPAAQAKLLRFLEHPEVERLGSNHAVLLDVRILAATNKNLAACIKDGSFREDLYHRLNVVNIKVPALRERPEDIEELTAYFLERFCRQNNRAVSFTPECMAILRGHNWPGNVRELRNLVERAVVLARTNPVEPDELASFLGVEAQVRQDGTLKAALDRAEREAVERALAAGHGNVSEAAQALGVERASLYRIMKRHGIPHEPAG
jgi:DNA-binding NtrC family response regulator